MLKPGRTALLGASVSAAARSTPQAELVGPARGPVAAPDRIDEAVRVGSPSPLLRRAPAGPSSSFVLPAVPHEAALRALDLTPLRRSLRPDSERSLHALGRVHSYTPRVEKDVSDFASPAAKTKAAQLARKTATIRAGIQQLTGGRYDLSSGVLFYPASGTDAHTPFLLGARRVVAMDNNPFLSTAPEGGPMSIAVKDDILENKEGFRFHSDINDAGRIGERIVGNLLAHLRPIKVLTIDVIEGRDKVHHRLYGEEVGPAMHGRVVFENSAGELCEYIHLNGNSIFGRASGTEWLDYLSQVGVSDVLVKGSNSGIFRRGSGWGTAAITRLIDGALKKAGGLLIEGHETREERYGTWEFTGTGTGYMRKPRWTIQPEHSGCIPSAYGVENLRPIKADGYFGYSQGAQVLWFGACK